MATPSRSVTDKAARLLAEDRIMRVEAAEVFAVEGDSGVHLVVLTAACAACSCPATGLCSHVMSARWKQAAEREHEVGA